MLKLYSRRDNTHVTAVRLNVATSGFDYEKWSHTQHCNAGDWVVDNGGDTYTINADSFASTYREVSSGRFEKCRIWARQSDDAGTIQTKEGATDYQAGDFLVYNNQDQSDGYAISAAKFTALYEEIESE